jgi:hypothetical protein
MLFRETVAVFCENHTEHTETLCGQYAEIYYVKAGGAYSDHWDLKCLKNKHTNKEGNAINLWFKESQRSLMIGIISLCRQ